MPETLITTEDLDGQPIASVRTLVDRVCRRIPPLWDLENYVAVNPFLGFTDQPIDDAARTVRDALGAQVLPELSSYRDRFEAGAFSLADLERAARRSGESAESLAAILQGDAPVPSRAVSPVRTVAERIDHDRGTTWNDAIIRQITRWCAVHASGGGTYWRLPENSLGLFASWREAAQADRSLEVLGLTGWRERIASLPEDATEAIAEALDRLGISAELREPYLARVIGGVFGWACFFRRESWEHGDAFPTTVAELLAIRCGADWALASVLGVSESVDSPRSFEKAPEDESTRAVFQDAVENGYARRLFSRFHAPTEESRADRPAVQGVFCIDVRSEVLRRHLEAQSEAIETKGFAGFFGVPLAWKGNGSDASARCPVLLKPAVTVASDLGPKSTAVNGAAKHLLGAPASAFEFVEIMGPAYSLGLAADAMALRSPKHSAEGKVPFGLDAETQGQGIAPPARVELAAGILKNMGLRDRFARLILLCGHESHSSNNPHAAGLDCGACGGHGGAINARVAAALLNDPAVRDSLRGLGWNLPTDTHFLPGVHDTSVDDVTLLDLDRVPSTHQKDVDQLRGWLDQAGVLTRAERSEALGMPERPAGLLARWLRRRARDWSEVRPEWGLARNAAFIAARRSRTRGANLEGRTFLHDYDPDLDEDGSVLTLILSAPMVVASWINLQYFASTVDNDVFGCGTKTLHNRVGSLGVVLGNGGDLRTGLAIQSVHDRNGHWFHEPLRLQVVVEAPIDRIDAVLAQQPTVRALVENGWVRLFALDPAGSEIAQRLPDSTWETVHDPEHPITNPSKEAMLISA
ncbi:YbcC family protein [Tautonia marina]|uniref:YbcC family protein n=1 Tax=Tautonia marina TaxID=2653855 RepID=UPI0013761CF1|nr:DUF2309 domain-containing protein [Tautonia marina]